MSAPKNTSNETSTDIGSVIAAALLAVMSLAALLSTGCCGYVAISTWGDKGSETHFWSVLAAITAGIAAIIALAFFLGSRSIWRGRHTR